MKYKFKSQTGILVAGMLAATYASACYYQQTSALCFASGDTVDTIVWNGIFGPSQGTAYVIASSDWLVTATGSSGYFTWDSSSGGPSYSDPTPDGSSAPTYCSGPAHFLDKSSHNTSVNSWMAQSTSIAPLWSHYNNTPVGGTVNTSSSTCSP